MGMDNFFMYTKNRRLNWIIFIIDESETLDDKVLVMVTWSGLFLLIIILLILTLSDKFVKKILNPLEELVLKMETFANSRNTQKFDVHSEYIFFKKLSDSFNKMQDKILKREKELDILNKTLEKRVKEEVEKNRQKDQQLINQSRLAQMGEMLSMIAHQWRQPLSAISSLSGKININARLKKLDHQTALELSSKISLYTQHLSSTIEDFRNFFRGDKEKKDTTYDEIIDDVLVILEVSIKNKNIELIKDMQSKQVFHTYSNEIKQVVLNLVKNAEDVLVERGVKDPKIFIRSKDNVLIVEDNAGGIPDEIKDKIFDPYFSTKEKKDGTGLGLYMSRIIIQDHCGGELIAQNTDKGAMFKIIL
jgi:C4-dicarboxylate-specific signal transduction histidine kinase